MKKNKHQTFSNFLSFEYFLKNFSWRIELKLLTLITFISNLTMQIANFVYCE